MISVRITPTATSKSLDDTDREILRMLQEDAHMNVRAIAARVHRSVSPVHERIRRLEEQGFIKRYTAILDRDKIGRPLLAVAQVRLSEQTTESTSTFIEAMKNFPAVILCLQLAGACDFLLHVAAGDTGAYQRFVDALCSVPFVAKVESHFVLREAKGDVAYPL